MLLFVLAAAVAFTVATLGTRLIEIEEARAIARARLAADVVHLPAFLEAR